MQLSIDFLAFNRTRLNDNCSKMEFFQVMSSSALHWNNRLLPILFTEKSTSRRWWSVVVSHLHVYASTFTRELLCNHETNCILCFVSPVMFQRPAKLWNWSKSPSKMFRYGWILVEPIKIRPNSNPNGCNSFKNTIKLKFYSVCDYYDHPPSPLTWPAIL